MTNVEKLINYIKSLTPEEAALAHRYLPRLLEEPANEMDEYIIAITKALFDTRDIALLDLILQLLQKSRKA